ncbi:transcriptional regulator FtrA [Erythrobacter sp. CCH5-A1]|jgi:AraC family transcriptional activator FtrA|uniref:transcriptional regulator FtrA n=1 Tax=Erythrobacter sp. CCH5-A1 TaxID=1768792 RepID=UPI0009E7A25E|nr:transcriptional regulator FtrA [Erythrobacter sp. CCH5-A1]
MPNLSGPLVVALLYDGLCTFEFGIVAEIFGLARPEMGPSWYRFQSCAIEVGPLRAHGGFTLMPDAGAELIDQADMIVVPGWKSIDAPVPPVLRNTLRAAHSRGARLASLCSGAFVLAATGLLDGKYATTHWRYAEALRRQFPAIDVDEASLYRIEDRICTSAGSSAGIDLMIEIVRQDFGPDAANSVARRIVMPGHRSGGQAQYLERPVRTRPDAEIAPVLDRIKGDIQRSWTIDEMAKFAKMSKRTFERRFGEATGQCPGEWLNAERVEVAKDILTRSSMTIEEIATAVGFASAHTLRHHFRQQVKQTPTEFRREFSHGGDRI